MLSGKQEGPINIKLLFIGKRIVTESSCSLIKKQSEDL